MIQRLLIGLCLAAFIGYAAYRAKALSRSGGWAAMLSGGLIFGLGGLSWATLLLTFFISSSVLSRAFKQKKTAVNDKYAKGSQRDWGQVLANGGLGAGLAIVSWIFPNQAWVWTAYIGAMAAVNADTWATELGVLNPTPPKLITTGREVEQGTSGAISPVGSIAALGGASLVGLVAGFFPLAPFGLALLTGILGGLAGSFFDSILGATVQAIYYCPTCQKETEKHPRHTCGTPTVQKRGWRWMNNDLVNFLCSLAGAVSALLAYLVLYRQAGS